MDQNIVFEKIGRPLVEAFKEDGVVSRPLEEQDQSNVSTDRISAFLPTAKVDPVPNRSGCAQQTFRKELQHDWQWHDVQ